MSQGHDYHERLPGYSPEQLLHDGCAECEQRSASRYHGIPELDLQRFKHAWKRAASWQQHGLRDIAAAEIPMFDALWAIQVQLEKRGIPIGRVPSSIGLDL